MGMYTYYKFDGTVKEKYRKDLQDIFTEEYPGSFEEKITNMNSAFKDFANGERSSLILSGSQCEDERTFNLKTGELHLACDIKDYSEQNLDGTHKEKNSSKLFIELLPELCDTSKPLRYSRFYEEDEMAIKYEYLDGKWACTNKEEYDKAFEEAHPYGIW